MWGICNDQEEFCGKFGIIIVSNQEAKFLAYFLYFEKIKEGL
jgi:hypothetical protein